MDDRGIIGGQPGLQIARALSTTIREQARTAEQLGTLPTGLVTRLRRADLFSLALPKSLDGAELPPADIVEIIEELSRADGATGWTTLVGNGTAFLAWLAPEVATDLLAPYHGAVTSTGFSPTGTLVETGAGRSELSGRWAFSSGCRHADLCINAAAVRASGRGRSWRFAVFPAARAIVEDNWDTAGLRGTGSHDVLADRVPVLDEHTFHPHDPAEHDGALWRLPFFTLGGVLMAGFPLGVARRALDELATMAPGKVRPPSPLPIAEDGDLQTSLARAEGGLRAARAFVFDTLGSLWDRARGGDVPSVALRADFLLATQQAMWAAKTAVDTAFSFAGAGALRLDHPVQRCFRDLHAATQHMFYTPVSAKRYARARLGLSQETEWF